MRSTPFFANRLNVSGEAGIGGNNQDPQNWGPPSLNFNSGFAALNDAQESFTRNQTSAASYSMMWLKRPHNITIGGDVRRIQLNLISQQDARGSFGFTGAATQATANGVGVPGTGSDFADFLLGMPDTSSIAFGNADKYFPVNLLRRLFHGRLAGQRGLHAERRRALGVFEPDRGKVRAAGEPGYRAGLWAGGAGAGQQSHRAR